MKVMITFAVLSPCSIVQNAQKFNIAEDEIEKNSGAPTLAHWRGVYPLPKPYPCRRLGSRPIILASYAYGCDVFL